ncbi:hypothetical protein BG006_005680 [Podila minutissima]|uniref:Dolichyl-phosphate-mannose--protein mannosyltransferase n=1 Tax=Podila minutissima TaxID=64525 RepID=A0A9P5VM63_9FUNG|nr:hypothetical protein BG006_005680 [Podila minutissima]
MRNGTSSAVDQTGIPVYRGTHLRTSSLNDKNPSQEHANDHHHNNSSNGTNDDDTNDIKGFNKKNLNLDENTSGHIAKSNIRRNTPWYQSRDLQTITAITALALVVRLWAIGYPTSVVFDEVHFGGFASKYIRGGFFMDVHPPLAKMLIALTGWIFGLDPSFMFKEIGLDYIEPQVPYVPMRLMGALMGVAVVPIAFYTVRNSGHSYHASVLAALLVLFENSITAQSRLILLDSPLILFTAFTALAWTNFHNQRSNPFSEKWFVWLCLTGVGLGLAGSCKWVGLFIIATIGCSTIKQLWDLLGDLRVTPRAWINHFIARAVFLIALPIAIYMLMFEVHFLLLAKSGDGDGFMSAPFQMTLGHSLQDSPLNVAYGARVTIRHQGTQGGYLHSHPSNYETGSKQQQITLYPHKDSNNEWIIQKRDGSVPESLEYVAHGDIVRLFHSSTDKNLHSHDHKPPMTEDENHFEVSGYGYKGFPGDANDEWRVEIVESDASDPEGATTLHTLRSKFKLVHANMNCDLFSHSVKLPKWGFEQQEVTCMRSAVQAKTIWMVESNVHESYPENATKVNYKKPGFLGKFIELNKVMWSTNAGLVESHPYDSRPSTWPLLRRGISFWGKDQKHIYLIGNWFTWGFSTASIVLYAVIRVLLLIRDKRGFKDDFSGLREYYELTGGFFFMAWTFHYLPFFLMERQLFLHHYLPALYFAILLLSVTFDLGFRFIPSRARVLTVILFASAAIYVFRMMSPLTYGFEWTRSQCEATKMQKTWDFDCNQYPETMDQYKANAAVSASTSSAVEARSSESILSDLTERILAESAEEPNNEEGEEVAAAKVVQGVDSLGTDTAVGQIVENVIDTSTPLDDPRVTDPALAVEHLPKEGDDEDVKPEFEFEYDDEETRSNDDREEHNEEEEKEN